MSLLTSHSRWLQRNQMIELMTNDLITMNWTKPENKQKKEIQQDVKRNQNLT